MPITVRTGKVRVKKAWRNRIRAAFTERLALKGTSLLLAAVLWFTVSVREPAEQQITVRVQPALDNGLALREQPPVVRALIRGSGRDILKLYSTPPAIRMSIGGDVGDSLTLQLRPSDVDLPPGVSAIVRDVQPRAVTLQFAKRRAQGGGYVRPADR